MNMKNILVTGLPGSGKTTLVRDIAVRLSGMNPSGFYTLEIREGRRRVGFELVGLRGSRAILSHVRFKGPWRVGRYGVDLTGFERFLDSLDLFSPGTGLYIIDEIGRMECLSERFCRIVRGLLDSGTPLLATVAEKGGGFITEVKERSDVVIHRVTPSNRAEVFAEVLREMGRDP